MRILPLALIAVGVFGVLKHFGLIDPTFMHLFWPLLLIGVGVAMLARGPRWRADMHERMHGRWERRMQRHFGPGWANLSEEERERFRAGMRQWKGAPCQWDGQRPSDRPSEASPPPPAASPEPGQPR